MTLLEALREAPIAFLSDSDGAVYRCDRKLQIHCNIEGVWHKVQWLMNDLFASNKWEIRTKKELITHLQKGVTICKIDGPDVSWRLIMEYQTAKIVDHAPYNIMDALSPEEWELV